MRKILFGVTFATLAGVCGLSLASAAQPPPAPPAPPADAAAPDPAVGLIRGRCVLCHEADLVLQARKPAAAWRDLVNEMVSRGAQVTDAEADQIQAYLEKNQSIPPPAP